MRSAFPAGSLLLPWALLAGYLLRAGPFGLSEEGSKALLLAWSVADQVPSAAITLGAPDIRFFLFLPLAAVWSGRLMAAKVLTLLAMAAAAALLYRWCARAALGARDGQPAADGQAESALLASGLLLLSPLTLQCIDSLDAAPFFLAIVALASTLNRRLALERGTLGGWFFAQIFLCGAAVSLHPAGLAYPAALMLYWWSEPKERRDRQIAMLAIPLIVGLTLIMRAGWGSTAFMQNPLPAAADIFSGSEAEVTLSVGSWLGGLALIATTAAVALHERRRLLPDLTGRTLMLSVLFGAVAADKTWALCLWTLLLYAGIPWLLRACEPLRRHGLLLQRGWLWLLLVIVCTVLMRTDRANFELARRNVLSGEDDLIRALSMGLDDRDGAATAAASVPGAPTAAPPASAAAKSTVVASPWPARTAVACKCAALPLPPAAQDPQSQLAMMQGVSYVILADNSESRALAGNFSRLGARVDVMAKQPGGVILRLKPARAEL